MITLGRSLWKTLLGNAAALCFALLTSSGSAQPELSGEARVLRQNPPEIQGARSRPNGVPATISFINNRLEPVRIYWIDYEGNRDTRPGAGVLLGPGQVAGMSAAVGAAFVVTDAAGNGLELHRADVNGYRVEIGGPRVNFAEPKRRYHEVTRGAWTIQIEQSLLEAETEREVAEKAAIRLASNLDKILTRLPEHSHGTIRSTKLFIMHGKSGPNSGFDSGLQYVADKEPDLVRSLDPLWNHAVVVFSARNYVELSDLWAMKALMHEMAHSYHHRNWPQTQPDIEKAWQNAVSKGRYRRVPDSESGAMIEAAYAITNGPEYFAELSTCYFSRINYHPEQREALKAYDPEGYEMIRKMWRSDTP